MFSRENLRFAADWLAVLTGVSFILSALIQEAVFARWGLDFTAIASVEDVVLGGVRFLAVLITNAVGFSFIVFLANAGDSVVSASGRRVDHILSTLVAGLGIAFLLAALLLASSNIYITSMMVALFGGGIVMGAAYLFSKLTLSPAPLRANLQRIRVSFPSWLMIIIWSASTVFNSAVLYQKPYPLKVEIGILPSNCQNAFAELKWIGSRAFVMKCGLHYYVIFIGEQRFSMER